MGVKEDISRAQLLSSGDAASCRIFVNDYSQMVLWRVLQLMKTHCHYPAREKVCTLKILQKQMKGGRYPTAFDQCDECLDSYIWFFEFLKKKLKSYQGRNECSLKTFIWSIIHSRTTYLEWLRWKYGRVF